MGTVSKLKVAGSGDTHFVRVTDPDHRGFVEFQFSIGDPSLYLEMTLPPPAFEEFCREHDARVLTQEQSAIVDQNERRWRFGDDEEE